MAIIYPDFSTINLLKIKPTDGELHLLRQLEKNLDDSYEIFFQPFLNGDMPDIVIVRKGFGVYIIEVKDWDLNSYKLNSYEIKVNNKRKKKYEWFVTKNRENHKITSPISQVSKYKDNLYNLHIDGLLEKKIKNSKMFGIVNCGIYFHKHSTSFCNNFIKDMKEENFMQYFDIFGFDDSANIVKIMYHRKMNKPSKLFDDNLYNSIKRNLLPPLHVKEQGIPITYSKEQEKVIISNNGRKKFKGVAGSGKTMCLAKKAVNAYLRTNKEVLILTFNISLRNYIHDKINQVRENFEWKNFKILNYHEFFISQANNYNLKIESKSDWDNPDFFESVKNKIIKYDTIIIDEIQDYKKSWVQLINKYFLENNGEYAVFGDEKQNIYNRTLDSDKAPYTQISGAWNKLKETFRLSSEITKLAQRFQEEFLKEKYVTDEILLSESQLTLELSHSTINYYFIDNLDINFLVEKYKFFLQENLLHENDSCFLGGKIDTLREVDFTIRKKYHQKTKSMFETKEMYQYLKEKLPEEKFEKEIKLIRRNKKLHFWNNSGLLKLSTIHSFKGWEVNTLFLIIENISIDSEEYLEEKNG